jgi:HlyD family secretion protein
MKFNLKTILLGVITLLLVVTVIFSFLKNGEYETYKVTKQDFKEIVNISGKVVPAQEIDLSFESNGKIESSKVEVGDIVKEGDILATLDGSEITSQINEKRANLQSAQAQLQEVVGMEQNNQTLSVNNNLLNILKKARIQADDIVKNSVDTFFENPDSRYPDFDLSLGNYFVRQDLSDQRYKINFILNDWKNYIDNLDQISVTQTDAQYSIDNLKQVEKILSTISSNGTEFKVTSSVTQAQIDAYISSISTSRNNIANLIVEIDDAVEKVRDLQADIPVLQASIDSVSAEINTLQVKLNQYVLRAPFDGVVTDEDLENGKFVNAGESIISLISDQGLEVEGFIPEVNISNININDPAVLVFDAFGLSNKFNGYIAHIDPRETIKDGVTTYRILIDFSEQYDEILSGMTTDIEIEKLVIENQIVIPKYLITKEGGKKYVTKLIGGDKNMIEIKTGRDDGRGNIIVTEGISEEDLIIIPE